MKVKVNDHYNFEVTLERDLLTIEGAAVQLDSSVLSEKHVSVIYQNRSYNIELVSEDKSEKTSLIKVNGNLYHVAIQDQYDLLLQQLGFDNSKTSKMKEIKAPMPGLVLNVVVEEGQEVNKGDNLLVLEAMKMENIIKSPAGGTVKKVLVSKGDKVEKNEILIQFS
ncbi:acetyl-CoA carboxylase biotin carboxyl carrier protein subunit [Pedobacter africanus]|uniref:Biotin carboxyl carrier protein n=1 Tax=Pedobacter africanus TaxID=151894 RepID=A0A1W2BLZ2_9SPHI|nr:acetyl-CoA carboxylase biotin carboxyl carrier protein subunit [Pedobacter africanus]SMC73803.1 biotin carboxyl carrier protein [Pedobacter africanus]